MYVINNILYLSNYPDQFYNVSVFPVASTLVMFKFFGSVNEVDSHNKSRQYDLALEKFWVTQCGWLRLCMKFYMGTTITNLRKLLSYGVKRDQYEKLISIR